MSGAVYIGDNVIDSRDVDERIDELRSDLSGTPFEDSDHDSDTLARLLNDTPEEWFALHDNWDSDLAEELVKLVKFEEVGRSATGDWMYGATFILDSYFKEYAQQLADDIGVVDSNAGWPSCHIDWDAAAESLKSDYTAVEIDDTTYWTRG